MSAAARVAVIGGGPAGLMAAECARAAGAEVDLFDQMASVGRKLLIAGKGGLNLTHSEPFDAFVERFGDASDTVRSWLERFDADAVRAWAAGLGIETFIGSSGRVFPLDLKAAPLLRGWVRRLRGEGVHFHVQHRWLGWNVDGALRFDTPHGERSVRATAVVLALGGGSWPILGADGRWVAVLAASGIDIAPLQPANCGFDVGWSEHLRQRFAGAPIKPVAIAWRDAKGRVQRRQGEFVLTETGVEGSLIYALSAKLRDAIARDGATTIELDLVPGRSEAQLRAALGKPRGSHSMAKHLHRQAGIDGAKSALLHEVLPRSAFDDAAQLAAAIKALPLRLVRARPLAEAISTAGGVRLKDLDAELMLSSRPGVFCAGEMLDWEAPTGGYLLTAALASGRIAGRAAAAWRAASS